MTKKTIWIILAAGMLAVLVAFFLTGRYYSTMYEQEPEQEPSPEPKKKPGRPKKVEPEPEQEQEQYSIIEMDRPVIDGNE